MTDIPGDVQPAQQPGVPLPAAGWYPDPRQAYLQRWWDGYAWTRYTANQSITVNVNAGRSGGQRPERPAAARRRPTLELDPATLASPGTRLAAFVIDQTILLGSMVLVAALSGVLSENVGAILLVAWFISAVVYALVYPAKYGQTLGKHLTGVQLIRLDNHSTALGGGTAFGREVIRGLGLYALGLGSLWITFDPNRQGWQDKVASTAAVKAAPRTAPIREFLAAPFTNSTEKQH